MLEGDEQIDWGAGYSALEVIERESPTVNCSPYGFAALLRAITPARDNALSIARILEA